MNKIIDCFTFYNELKMLSFRLKELNDAVDYFVLCEATLTFSGQPKELIYQNNKHLFEEYNHKIIHVIVDDMPTNISNLDNWEREYYQRNSLMDGIMQLDVKDTDVILISDCDEIAKPELLKQIKIHGLNIFVDEKNSKYGSLNNEGYDDTIVAFLQDFYYYNLECKHTNMWSHPKAMTFTKLKEIGSLNKARQLNDKIQYYQNGGWHFSYFGDVDNIINKIKSFSHQEYNKEEYLNKEKIEEYIKNNKDLFGRDFIAIINTPIEFNDNLPSNYKMLINL